VTLRIRNNTFASVEINFLCIHKKLRSKRLAPVLIKEITRRCHVEGIWEAVYTAGVVLPKPVATCRYFHRALNWTKLFETGFSPLPPGSTKERMVMRNRLPDTTKIEGIRLMEERDVEAVTVLLGTYLGKFDLAPVYSEEHVRHWLLHNGDEETRVIWTYVVEVYTNVVAEFLTKKDSSKKITDFFSFYSLPSTVIKYSQHPFVRAAYLFHYGTTTPSSPKPAYQKRLQALAQDALIMAKKLGFDVFNALTLLDNSLFLEELKFGAGDGHLNYYLFNYRAMPIAGGTNARGQLDSGGSGVALVML
jgi:glycylpeptide N-tetradecanoyltransferase